MSKNKWGNVCDRVDTCALTGAAAFAAGIRGTEILANGPLWCYFYALRHLEHAVYNMSERFHGSQPDNNAIVYGSEKFVEGAIERLLADGHRPELLFIESSCSLSLIGDDLAGVVRRLQLPFPTVTMDCGGMLGGFAAGYSKACRVFLERFAIDVLPVEQQSVNLIGLTDFYYNGAADRVELLRVLQKAGYKINAVCGSGGNINMLGRTSAAALNIVLHEELGLEAAKYLQQRFGTPYICAGLPYGTEGTKEWLRKINEVLPCTGIPTVEAECDAMEEYLTAANNDMSVTWGNLWFDKAIVAAPATTAQCLAQALRREWADMGELIVISQQGLTNDYCSEADRLLIAGQDYEEIAEALHKEDHVLLLGSSSEQSVFLRRANCDFYNCNIAYPVSDELLLTNVPFVGIKGSAHMLQRLWNTYMNKAVRNG